MSRLKSMLRIARIEAFNNIFSIKGLTVILTLFFFIKQELDSLLNAAVNYKCNIGWAILPYLHEDVVYTLIFAMSILYYYSDAPFLSNDSNYQLLQVGRKRWVFIKNVRILYGAVLLMVIEVVISLLVCMPRVEFSNEWGKFWNTLSLTKSLTISFPRNIVILYSPFTAMLRVFAIGCLIVYFMGLLQFTVTLFLGKKYAITVCGIIACGPVLAANSEYANIYYISPVSWIGIVEHSLTYRYTGPNILYMFCVLIGLIFVLSIVDYYKIQRIDL